MTFEQVKSQDQAYILPTYGRVDAALVKGRNARPGMWTARNTSTSPQASASTPGIQRPGVGPSCGGPGGRIQHLCNYYYSPENTALAQELSQASGMAKAFFCNSGAEANECAVKIARKYGEKRGAYKIVTLNNSFHGRTLTTLAATGQEGFHKDFLPLTEASSTPKPGTWKASGPFWMAPSAP